MICEKSFFPLSLPRPPTPCLSFSFFLYYLLCSLLYFQPLKFTGLMRKENHSCGETTEVCPKTTLGHLNLIYSVASKQQLNCRNLREKKKKAAKIQQKPWKKHLLYVYSQDSGPSNLPYPCINMIKQNLFTFFFIYRRMKS